MRTMTPGLCVTRDTRAPHSDTRVLPILASPLAMALACAIALGWAATARAEPAGHEDEFMPTRIRVGLPAGTRRHLIFPCEPLRPATVFRGQSYESDSLSPLHFVLHRATGAAPVFGAPDTLEIRLFPDLSDQEIALERGELDVAVFWPGERSARLRQDERWADAARGVRAHGALVAIAAARDSGARTPARDLRLLGRTMFNDDLVAWDAPAEPLDRTEVPTRYVVDPALPGAKLLERVLGRLASPAARRTVRIAYMDRITRETAWEAPLTEPVFAIGCPVLLSGAFTRAFVDAPSADDWVSLLRCPGERP